MADSGSAQPIVWSEVHNGVAEASWVNDLVDAAAQIDRDDNDRSGTDAHDGTSSHDISMDETVTPNVEIAPYSRHEKLAARVLMDMGEGIPTEPWLWSPSPPPHITTFDAAPEPEISAKVPIVSIRRLALKYADGIVESCFLISNIVLEYRPPRVGNRVPNPNLTGTRQYIPGYLIDHCHIGMPQATLQWIVRGLLSLIDTENGETLQVKHLGPVTDSDGYAWIPVGLDRFAMLRTGNSPETTQFARLPNFLGLAQCSVKGKAQMTMSLKRTVAPTDSSRRHLAPTLFLPGLFGFRFEEFTAQHSQLP